MDRQKVYNSTSYLNNISDFILGILFICSPLLTVAQNNLLVFDRTDDYNKIQANNKLDVTDEITIETWDYSRFAGLASALDFDGVNDYIEIPSNPLLTPNTNNITIEAWIKLDSLYGSLTIASKYNSLNPAYKTSWNFYVGSGGNLHFIVIEDLITKRRAVDSDPGTVNDSTWQHVAASYNNSTQEMKLYLNGVEVNTTFTPGFEDDLNMINNNNAPVIIGAAVCSSAGVEVLCGMWDGRIDEVRIWNDVRTPTEIQDNYDCELMGNESGLVAYYQFEQGISGGNNAGLDSLNDQGPNNFDGTLKNFSLSGDTSNWVESGAMLSGICMCEIITTGLTNIQCQDNGTSSNPADDYISFELDPTGKNLGGGYIVSATNMDTSAGSYGPLSIFQTNPGTAGAGNILLTVTDSINGSCTINVNLVDPDNCSPDCEITELNLTNIQCQDNGTSSNPTDDYSSFELNPAGTNLGGGYIVSATNMDTSAGSYGSSSVFQTNPGSAGTGNITLTITDSVTNTCSMDTILIDPGTCSTDCGIVDVDLTNIQCHDNGTDLILTDDYLSFELNPSGFNLSAGYTVSGTNVTPTGANYGALDTFQTDPGTAGSGDINLVVTDTSDANCFLAIQLTDPGVCSSGAFCPDSMNISFDTIPSGSYSADRIIVANGNAWNGDSVFFYAGDKILLDTGFLVAAGAVFEAVAGVVCVSSLVINPQKIDQDYNPSYELEFIDGITLNFDNQAAYTGLRLPENSNIEILIYDSYGRLIRQLENAAFEKGLSKLHWDGKVDFGNNLKAGVYLVQIIINGRDKVRKISVIR